MESSSSKVVFEGIVMLYNLTCINRVIQKYPHVLRLSMSLEWCEDRKQLD